MNKKKKIDKSLFKMTPEELKHWLHFRKAHSCVENKRGKGSYKRKPKYPDRSE
jgi:stalled ribosome alternative rescue factor ArfA